MVKVQGKGKAPVLPEAVYTLQIRKIDYNDQYNPSLYVECELLDSEYAGTITYDYFNLSESGEYTYNSKVWQMMEACGFDPEPEQHPDGFDFDELVGHSFVCILNTTKDGSRNRMKHDTFMRPGEEHRERKLSRDPNAPNSEVSFDEIPF